MSSLPGAAPFLFILMAEQQNLRLVFRSKTVAHNVRFAPLRLSGRASRLQPFKCLQRNLPSCCHLIVGGFVGSSQPNLPDAAFESNHALGFVLGGVLFTVFTYIVAKKSISKRFMQTPPQRSELEAC